MSERSFKSVFIATGVSTALVVGAWMLSRNRPSTGAEEQSSQHVKATGKCASCHRAETSSIVHEYERSVHAAKKISCLDCHQPAEGQEGVDHKGFKLAKDLTAANCKSCHTTEYEQFARSRHAAPAWAAVAGKKDFSEAQLKEAMKYHPKAVDRAANGLAQLEGSAAITSGCDGCHAIGKPNQDGTFGSCTECHSRHSASVALARTPSTCGQCHMGPDHSQIEIYNESKHGALFAARRHEMNLSADPKALSTADMPVPTCSTCHMSGLEGMNVTHDTTERLSYFLYAPVSEKRPNFAGGQAKMQEVCLKCHARTQIDQYYKEAEAVVVATNKNVGDVMTMMAGLRKDGLLTKAAFDEPIEFLEFDYWHYFGRTAKHGAFMGGADFVQWHGNYELLKMKVELEEMAHELRARKAKSDTTEGEETEEAKTP